MKLAHKQFSFTVKYVQLYACVCVCVRQLMKTVHQIEATNETTTSGNRLSWAYHFVGAGTASKPESTVCLFYDLANT